MKPSFYLSSPDGDIPLDGDDLRRPFLLSPSEPHPHFTLGDYFKALFHFVLNLHRRDLLALLGEFSGEEPRFSDIRDLAIRSEKHGALYHLASIEVTAGPGRAKFAVSTALSEKGKACLHREYEILKTLNSRFELPYLPRAHFQGDLHWNTLNGTTSLSMVMSEWFDDYHEWHLSLNRGERRQGILIWDQRKGSRFASQEEGFEIFRQAAKILTLYYDTRHFHQIYPWHHAGGDFIVRTGKGNVAVRLTTAREYGPFLTFREEKEVNPWTALIFFFLNLTIRNRLDKLDGVGEVSWAGKFSVPATVAGFFEALNIMEGEGRYPLGKVDDLVSLFKAFSEAELKGLAGFLLELYRREDPQDLAVIKKNLPTHVDQLRQAIGNYHG